MALLISQAGEWFLTICTVIWARTLYILFLSSSICTAGELEELSVTEASGVYRLRIVSVLDAPVDYVYDVITDYEHAYRINPSITEIEILPSDRNDVVRVRNRSEHWVGPFRFEIDWAGDFVETKPGQIKVKIIPEFSSFESGSAIWEIRPQGEHTWVLHESSLKAEIFHPSHNRRFHY